MTQSYIWTGDKLTIDDLVHQMATAELSREPTIRDIANGVCVLTISHFLGHEWYLQHAHLKTTPQDYLQPVFDEDERAIEYTVRVFNLAEMMLHLQHSEGFGVLLGRMNRDQIQSAFAELQFGMLLYQEQLSFRYIDSDRQDGPVCDIEIDFPHGTVVSAEVKCKYDGQPYSDSTLSSALAKARRQLPAEGEGIIFVKVPTEWTALANGELHLPSALCAVTDAFLRNTSRVLKVIYYVTVTTPGPTHVRQSHAVTEIANPRLPAASPWRRPVFRFRGSYEWVHIPEIADRVFALMQSNTGGPNA